MRLLLLLLLLLLDGLNDIYNFLVVNVRQKLPTAVLDVGVHNPVLVRVAAGRPNRVDRNLPVRRPDQLRRRRQYVLLLRRALTASTLHHTLTSPAGLNRDRLLQRVLMNHQLLRQMLVLLLLLLALLLLLHDHLLRPNVQRLRDHLQLLLVEILLLLGGGRATGDSDSGTSRRPCRYSLVDEESWTDHVLFWGEAEQVGGADWDFGAAVDAGGGSVSRAGSGRTWLEGEKNILFLKTNKFLGLPS